MKAVYQTEHRERRYSVIEAGLPDVHPRTALHRHRSRSMRRRWSISRIPSAGRSPPAAKRSGSAAITSGNTPRFPGRSSKNRSASPLKTRAIRAGSLSCFHKRKVTATVAVQCPPRVVSQRVFVSRPVVRERLRDPLCPRNHGSPGARHELPLRRRGTGRVDSRHHVLIRRRRARRALSGSHVPVCSRGARRIDPGHHVFVRRRRARRAL